MNVWALIGLTAIAVSVATAISMHLCAKGILTPASWAGFGATGPLADPAGWQRGHRATLPVIWAGTSITVAVVLAGWFVSGFEPESGPWTLVGLLVFAVTLMVGSTIARRNARR